MRKVGVLLGVVFLLASCASNDYKVENKMLMCFYKQCEDNGIDIKGMLDSIEEAFIDVHFLSDKSGESYMEVFRFIYENNDAYLQSRDMSGDYLKPFINSIEDLPVIVICDSFLSLGIDSTDYANSKLRLMAGIADSIQQKGDISPRIVADEYLKIFEAKDFENDFYRAFGLIMFANLIKMEPEIMLQRRLPH